MSSKNRTYAAIIAAIVLSMIGQMLLLPAGVAAGPASVPTQPSGRIAPLSGVSQDLPLAGPFAQEILAGTAAAEPLALSGPLSIVQLQSSFLAGGDLVVTYHVRNELGPILQPDANSSSSTDDIVAAIEATDFAGDPNVIHDALLTLQLTDPQTGLVDASHPADRDGDGLVFNLGDLPPLGQATLVLTLSTPASAGDFRDLDTGATAYGNWQGRAVSAAATPLSLAPDGLAQWLACTPDANCQDLYVARQAAALGHDPSAIFAFVRGLGYESYAGSLRGARGTLWSEAGNGYDQASLFIALLRASGIPATYRLGSLGQADAQTLITSIFPAVTAPSGNIPSGATVADPANDPALIAEVQDHAWAEAYLPSGGWTVFDPSFPAAQSGDLFGTPSGGQLVELPDAARHKVTVELEVEKYGAFPVGGVNLYSLTPLTATFNTVDLVGAPLVFAHLVKSDDAQGMAYATAQHTYTPYFVAGISEELVEGEAFVELISNFPLAQDFVTAEWLDFTVTSPSGQSDTYRRELFDDIGYEARIGGGAVGQLARDATARLSLMSSWTTLVAPSAVPPEAMNDAYQEMIELSLAGAEVRDATAGLIDTEYPTDEQIELAREAAATYGKMARLGQRLHLLKFAAASHQAHDYLGQALLVKSYAGSPRLFTVGWERNDQTETDSISFDLLRNRVRAIAYPGQTDTGLDGFVYWRALLDTAIEHQVLAEVAPTPVTSVGAVLDKALAEDITLERVTLGTLDELAALPLSDQAKARITTALSDNPNQHIIVPDQMVLLDGASEPTVGWLQIDNETLEVIDTMENGQHMVAVQYAALAKFSKKAGSFIGGFSAGFFGHTMGFWIGFFEQMPLDGKYIGAVIANSKQTADEWGKQGEKACNKKSDKKWCKRGAYAGNALGSAILAKADPPLQEALFVLPLDPPAAEAQASVLLNEAATLGGSAVVANVSTALVGVYGPASHAWTSAGQNVFAFDSLTLDSAKVYDNGVLLDSGPLEAVPTVDEPATARTDGSSVDISGQAVGSVSLHAPALAPLAAGSQYDSYAFELSVGSTYTLSLSGATVSVNGSSYGGDLQVVSSEAAALTGTAATAAPNFADSAVFVPAGGGLSVASASGSLTVGGGAVDASSGFALGNVSSPAIVSPSGSQDLFAFNGSADFFKLNLSSQASAAVSGGATGFDAGVDANFAGTYTLTISAPEGWDVSVDGAGLVSAQSPSGAAAGDYAILVTAQSSFYPDLFVSGVHLVTVTGADGVTLDVAPDPTYTVPWGSASEVINFDSSVGQVQLPGAAFALTVQNTSSVARTFDLDVTGLPAGWAILGAQAGSTQLQLVLAAGERVQLGLYVSPDVGTLPPPANAYPFTVTVTATDNAGVTAGDNDTFTMPSLPYPILAVEPAELYVGENNSASFDLTLTNAGNFTGTFDLLSTVPVSGWSLSNLQSPVALDPGESASQTVTITVTTGEPGVDHPVAIGSPAPTVPYTPLVAVDVYVAGAYSLPIFQAAQGCVLDSDSLAAALETLALSVSDLETSCDSGACSLVDRDRVVDAIRSTADYAEAASEGKAAAAGDLPAIADALSVHSDVSAIEADLTNLAATIDTLALELCELEEHRPTARFTPYLAAVLLGETASFSLDVTNWGTLSTTYAVTVTTPTGDQTFNMAVDAATTVTQIVTTTPALLGAFDLSADVVALAPDIQADVRAQAQARLNVVDKFVQVTRVVADPNFVETGTSSTELSVEVANTAGVAQEANARTSILAAGGGISWTADIPLNVLVGSPHTYALQSVNTSGWAAGIYSVTVELLDSGDALIPNGSGYGVFAVGQALGASHSVEPVVVPPGTLTVTTRITTEVLVPTIFETASTGGLLWSPTGLRSATPGQVAPAINLETVTQDTAATGAANAPTIESEEPPLEQPLGVSLNSVTGTIILRYEESEAATAGTWTSLNSSRASSGSYLRASTAGDTAAFSFSGSWVNLGFLGDRFSGQAQITIDGASYGVLDLYRHDETPISFVYSGLISASHVLTVTAQGTANPLADNVYVKLDYLDAYSGGSYADGSFEQDDTRAFLSSGWTTVSDGTASGGSYIRGGAAAAWFPFTGTSVSYQALAYSSGGKVQIALDGIHQTTLDLYSAPASITRTLSFTGLVAGPHILQIQSYRGNTTVDAFATPGNPPFFAPPAPGAFTRFEEDHTAFLYNGLPFTVTAQSWTRNDHIYASEASDGQRFYSQTASDTASLTFEGSWTSIGFFTDENSGQAEIFLDSASQGIVDLYSNEDDVTSFTYAGLSSGTHTISVTVQGTANPRAGGQYVNLDYVDAWDGSTMPAGRFEQTDARVFRSGGWTDVASGDTSGGSYSEAVLHGEPSAWFPFTGDSVTYQAFDYFRSDRVAIYIDEAFQGRFDIRTGIVPTITHSFDNLGAGLHMLKLRDYRDEPTLDAFVTPATTASTPPLTPTVFTRYEEDDPAIRYNGLPYTVTASTWDRPNKVGRASDGQFISSDTPGDWVSFSFSGTWVNAGFVTDRFSGQAQVFIDGSSQGTIDLYTRDADVASFAYGGLADTSHTISVTILGTSHPNASGYLMMVDYLDTWNGDPLPAATYEEDHRLVYRGDSYDDWVSYAEAAASGGSYVRDGFQRESTVWFPFSGDSVTFLGLANNDGDRVRIDIDGVSMGTFNLYSSTPITRPFSFDGLGSGPHILQVRHNRAYVNVDAFVVPGSPPFFQAPTHTGIVRYEEDHPSIDYNGLDGFRTRPQSWYLGANSNLASSRWYAYSAAVSDTASLTFDGLWAAVGFRVRNGTSQAEVYIDGVSQGALDLDNDPGEDVRSYQFGGLVSGTHTISVSVAAGSVYLDYFDIWDGQPMPDDYVNTHRGEDDARLHYTTGIRDSSHPNAIGGDMVVPSLYYAGSNVWYSFVGDAFTLLGVTHQNGSLVDVYVDGVFVETADLTYPFSEQPLAFHYTGLSNGPHVVRVSNSTHLRVDAFRSNPTQTVPYLPQAEWWDDTPNGGNGSFGTPAGMLMGIASGDLDGDGLIEIVAPSDTYTTGGFINSIFVYRGDGQDAGNGNPLITRIDFPADGIGVGRETIGSVALANLDGLPGAEIIVGSDRGMYAFYGDGTTYWFTDTFPGGSNGTVATPAVGDLDLDGIPEIVINMGDELVVYTAGGDVAWSETYTTEAGMPILADMTGDGLLDIVAYDVAGQVRLYDYNYGTPVLQWLAALSTTISIVRGGPAVADLDGNGEPEIAIAHDGYATALDKDGNLVWSTPLDPGSAGGVSAADLDGDQEIEIVTGMRYDDGTGKGRLYTLNADGSILWQRPAYDDTSANSQSVLDLDGDGVYEIAWNGAQYGFTIFNGADGAILFNEPLAKSLTGTDYPIFADVDGDGYAEIVVPGNDGVAVFGMDGVWGDARPIWNQHSYHITNISDDLSIPLGEANSWDVHNTYRTQTPLNTPLPVYAVEVTHTVAISGVEVLTTTFSVSPDLEANPVYVWADSQTGANPVVTRTFNLRLPNLRPGESRLVAQGTEVAYSQPSGQNRIPLPPLYVSAPHIVTLAPAERTVAAGGTAVYDVTLYNPDLASSDTYGLSLAGIPSQWAAYPVTVPISAGEAVTVSLTITVPAGSEPDALPVVVDVSTSKSAADQAAARLVVIDGVDVAITPSWQTASLGEAVTYTLIISNYEGVQRTYSLSASGLAGVNLPGPVTVDAGGATSVQFTASATDPGSLPFTLVASVPGGAADSDDAVLEAVGVQVVALSLAPNPAASGPGSTAELTLTVTNTGDVPGTFDLSVALPTGWSYVLQANGQAVSSLALPPHLFNTADLTLLVTPNVGATTGGYSVTVTATPQDQNSAAASTSGTVEVLNRGVQVEILSGPAQLDPRQQGVWQVRVTNTGEVAGTFDLQAAGLLALAGSFSVNEVTLDPGSSQTVQLTSTTPDQFPPQTYPVVVAAIARNDDRIRHQVETNVSFTAYDSVDLVWRPPSKTVSDTLSAELTLVITNTGNASAVFALATSATPSAGVSLLAQIQSLPPGEAAILPVAVQLGGGGVYQIEATATTEGGGAQTSDTATLTATMTAVSLPPVAAAGADQTAGVSTTVSLDGSGSYDPDGNLPLSYGWMQVAGTPVALSSGTAVSPTFTAPITVGLLTFTLTVTDSAGRVDATPDTVVVTVTAGNQPPVADAGADQTAGVSATVKLDGSGSHDPDSNLPLAYAWNQSGGPPVALSGADQLSTTFTAPAMAAVLTFTLTVTDSAGLADPTPDQVVVTVGETTAAFRSVYLPFVVRNK